jgi:hypothetical protein
MEEGEDEAGGDDDLERGKQLRIKLPLSYHLKLHKLKLLTGKNMAEAIQEALDVYFESVFTGTPEEPVAKVPPRKESPPGGRI